MLVAGRAPRLGVARRTAIAAVAPAAVPATRTHSARTAAANGWRPWSAASRAGSRHARRGQGQPRPSRPLLPGPLFAMAKPTGSEGCRVGRPACSSGSQNTQPPSMTRRVRRSRRRGNRCRKDRTGCRSPNRPSAARTAAGRRRPAAPPAGRCSGTRTAAGNDSARGSRGRPTRSARHRKMPAARSPSPARGGASGPIRPRPGGRRLPRRATGRRAGAKWPWTGKAAPAGRGLRRHARRRRPSTAGRPADNTWSTARATNARPAAAAANRSSGTVRRWH